MMSIPVATAVTTAPGSLVVQDALVVGVEVVEVRHSEVVVLLLGLLWLLLVAITESLFDAGLMTVLRVWCRRCCRCRF
jgi:hypothetical protein